MTWDLVIGLEVHAQLNTQSKLFSGSPTLFGAAPNSQTSFIDAGLPGVLPVLNQQAVYKAIQFGLSINAHINNHSFFERKNYFYPDLPKGYQISQFQCPIVENGHLNITLSDGNEKAIKIVRAHLEEDAGKSLHDAHSQYTSIDLNRAGTPLLEIVTAPCLFSAEEALIYLKTLHRLLRFLNICDGNMQEGSFRCDVNLSLKPAGSDTLGSRVELKNLNSFRFIQNAISYEQKRQQELLESGKSIAQETRLYCPNSNKTQLMRSKENENDYRYFPDPDLLPIPIESSMLDSIRATMPVLPQDIETKLRRKGNLAQEDIEFMLSSPAIYRYFAELTTLTNADEKTIANWMKGNLAGALNEAHISIENSPLTPQALAPLLDSLSAKKINNNQAKTIFTKLFAGQGNLEDMIAEENLSKAEDYADIIPALLEEYPEQAASYKAGKEKLLAFFVGQVMKRTQGKADPERVSDFLKKYFKMN